MKRFDVGDRVRIDIPDTHDPDHDRLHRKQAVVTNVIKDCAGAVTNDQLIHAPVESI